MFARFASFFGARRAPVASSPATDVLPPECVTILAAVSFADRGPDDEGAPRIIVTLPGSGAFRYGSDSASAWLRARFGLNDAQMARALQMLRARLADYQRQQTTAAVGHGERWADWRPLEM
ncbi:TPA: hypothetical protein QDC20_003638 [Burkholderia aenigmatica]|uniref:hypothetical protein n=1 Tax=Burkholderia sp. AU45251 TaxID=3059204 RepID=UPI002654567C|nr:hypothetical protein [Burkholderia sp. AU45251]HDR9482821.1 hypothetical protein [Burkholderia aenigmatica]MDN7519495.1 hypothetical protein [Burkholderia sp. AU45251]HDR9513768.1 hypothetical protein [Burkholderia aenigmatica]HDR9591159.1 hypothetical protein [Burkholderia aenigmatica]HDR9599141.1 hypothetical protein [Burkholderia aenigmatica]